MQCRLLSDVPRDELQQVLTIARRRPFDRGEVVFHEDDPADSLHLVVSGRFAARIRTPVGDTTLLAIYGPGDAFGELALVSPPSHRSATVVALEPADYVLETKTLPTPGPSMKFKVRVRGRRHSGTDQITR